MNTTNQIVNVSNFDRCSDMLKVATHNAVFHADDCLAVAMVLMANPGRTVALCRTRDVSVINDADVVIDVGGVYAPDDGRFDHHQVRESVESEVFGFTGCASAGLVWDWYGEEVVSGHLLAIKNLLEGVDFLDIVKEVHKSFISGVDAIDTGAVRPPEGMYTFSKVVGGFNPAFGGGFDAAFVTAVGVAVAVLGNEISQAAARCRDAVEADEAFASAFEGVAIFDRYLSGWQDKCPASIDRVIFPKLGGGGFTVQRPEGRRDIPVKAEEIMGDEVIFIHQKGFVGACRTLAGALQLAKL